MVDGALESVRAGVNAGAPPAGPVKLTVTCCDQVWPLASAPVNWKTAAAGRTNPESATEMEIDPFAGILVVEKNELTGRLTPSSLNPVRVVATPALSLSVIENGHCGPACGVGLGLMVTTTNDPDAGYLMETVTNPAELVKRLSPLYSALMAPLPPAIANAVVLRLALELDPEA